MERLIACILIAALTLPTMSCAELATATAVGASVTYDLQEERSEEKKRFKEAAMKEYNRWHPDSEQAKSIKKEIEKNEEYSDAEFISELVVFTAVTALVLGAALIDKKDQKQQDGAGAERAPRRNQEAREDAQSSFAGGYIPPRQMKTIPLPLSRFTGMGPFAGTIGPLSSG